MQMLDVLGSSNLEHRYTCAANVFIFHIATLYTCNTGNTGSWLRSGSGYVEPGLHRGRAGHGTTFVHRRGRGGSVGQSDGVPRDASRSAAVEITSSGAVLQLVGQTAVLFRDGDERVVAWRRRRSTDRIDQQIRSLSQSTWIQESHEFFVGHQRTTVGGRHS
jgi:hypothetical protein